MNLVGGPGPGPLTKSSAALRTRLIHISPSSSTIFRLLEIILEMGTVQWIGLQIHYSKPEVGKFVQ